MSEVKIESFAGNSNKDREDKKPAKKEIKKVVKGDVKTRKKPIGKRVIEALLPKEDISVKDYIMFDVIVPCIKDTILDSISMVFYGTTSRRDRKYRKANSGGTRISYASYYKDDDDDRRDRRSSRRSETSSIDDIIFETRAEAQEVLNSLADIIDEYGSASIADFCDLCGITEEYTDHKYGWTDVSKSTVEAVRGGGFVINLPRARQIG